MLKAYQDLEAKQIGSFELEELQECNKSLIAKVEELEIERTR